jgi:hypothetical protein
MGTSFVPAIVMSLLLMLVLINTRTSGKTRVTRLQIQIGATHDELESNDHITHSITPLQSVLCGLLVSLAAVGTCGLAFLGIDNQSKTDLSRPLVATGSVLSFVIASIAPAIFFRYLQTWMRMAAHVLFAVASVILPLLAITDPRYVYTGVNPSAAGNLSLSTMSIIAYCAISAVALALVVLNVSRTCLPLTAHCSLLGRLRLV